ncbi:Gfo/Idh/MocA family protein [Alicyclobacillus herbarius]|uniref:Gfo/Idh/MocA family protein n=1 Tax=Alicyclobacillus herbarius TaxID=122960 RepID=UPI0003F737DA|nr:Gfo/Idh/MocA family oxidoreductase [Alicyclobacillus herbarius]
MNALIVGFGSIGQRHGRILAELGCPVAVVSHRDGCPFPVFRTVKDALETFQPGYVVIANRTSEHYGTFAELSAQAYDGVVLIEKPLFATPYRLPLHPPKKVFVGYNLRFHPVLQQLRSHLEGQSILSAQVYAGQYLPTWRPDDYRNHYSSKRSEGGGVLRDLSHELDYVQWLFGPWTRITAIGGHYSHLEIDSDDAFALLMSTNQCPIVNIQINYLDRFRRREVLVNTDTHTYRADLVRHTIQVDHSVEMLPCDSDTTYRAQHTAVLTGEHATLCSIHEAQETMELIVKAEQTASQGRWVTR